MIIIHKMNPHCQWCCPLCHCNRTSTLKPFASPYFNIMTCKGNRWVEIRCRQGGLMSSISADTAQWTTLLIIWISLLKSVVVFLNNQLLTLSKLWIHLLRKSVVCSDGHMHILCPCCTCSVLTIGSISGLSLEQSAHTSQLDCSQMWNVPEHGTHCIVWLLPSFLVLNWQK